MHHSIKPVVNYVCRLVCKGNRDYAIESHEAGKDRKKSVFGDLVCQDNGFDTAVFVGSFAKYLKFLENDYGKNVRIGFIQHPTFD